MDMIVLSHPGNPFSSPVATIPGQTMLAITSSEETIVASRRQKAFITSLLSL
jgi:hypothetical protein